MGGGRFDPTKAQWQKAFCVLPDGHVAVDHDEKIRGLPSYGLDTEHSEPVCYLPKLPVVANNSSKCIESADYHWLQETSMSMLSC